MIDYITKEIKNNPSIINSTDDAYNYLFNVISSNCELINSIDYVKFQVILSKLELTIGDFVFCASRNGHIQIIESFFKLVQDQKIIKEVINEYVIDAFMLAAICGHVELMKYLVNITTNDDLKKKMININKTYILQIASEKGYIEVLKYLCELVDDKEAFQKLINNQGKYSFIIAASNGNVELMKYLLTFYEDNELKEHMIHYNNNEAFRIAAKNMRFEVMDFLLKITQDPDKKMMLLYDSYISFSDAATYGKLEVMKYILKIQNPDSREELIGLNTGFCFLKAVENGHIDVLGYLISIIPEINDKKNLIHRGADINFSLAWRNLKVDVMKYLVIQDPYYAWPTKYDNISLVEIRDEIIKINTKNIIYYKNIDIISLKNIATSCKNLFSDIITAKTNKDDNKFSITDLPKDILLTIVKYIANVKEEHDPKLLSSIKAFTYNIDNYSGGFLGFTSRYEDALKELGVIKDDIIDNIE